MIVRQKGVGRHFRTVSFDCRKQQVHLIDQRVLPHRFKIVQTQDYIETATAIQNMIVRGAGAIGATAAYGLVQGILEFSGQTLAQFKKHVKKVYSTLKNARPTAIDPVNAMDQICRLMGQASSVAEQTALAIGAAETFANEQVNHCEQIGLHGASLIKEGMRILTHCNAGWLAFVDIGSATAPFYEAQKQSKRFHVYCDETRPRCQGATLTAWELSQQGISHQIIADNAAGHLMQRGMIDMVIVGSDRVLGRTGEVANKIGTYTKAVLAHRHQIPFYVAIPLSTFDWQLESGNQIPIEERDPSEVLGAWGINKRSQYQYVRIADPDSSAVNPGFDVTPAELVTGIITPLGIFKPKELWAKRSILSNS